MSAATVAAGESKAITPEQAAAIEVEAAEVLPSAPAQQVQLDGLVLLKIITHCRDFYPETVQGQLLGFEHDGILEVNHSFPMPQDVLDDDEDEEDSGNASAAATAAAQKAKAAAGGAGEDDEDDEDALDADFADTSSSFQLEMMKNLRDTNVESEAAGWYRSSDMSSFVSEEVVQAHYELQSKAPSSVLIVYDPFQTRTGNLCIKAYRLSEKMMAALKDKKLSAMDLTQAELYASGVFEELPIQLHNSHLVHGFLYELRTREHLVRCDEQRLDLASRSRLKRHITNLSTQIDRFGKQQNDFHYWHKQATRQKQQQQAFIERREEQLGRKVRQHELDRHPLFREMPAPSHLETLLLSERMEESSRTLARSASLGLHKMYVAKALNEEEE